MICGWKSVSQPWEYINTRSRSKIWNMQLIGKKNTISVFFLIFVINLLSACVSVTSLFSSINLEKAVVDCVYFPLLKWYRKKKRSKQGLHHTPVVRFQRAAKVISKLMNLQIHRGRWRDLSCSLLHKTIWLLAVSPFITSWWCINRTSLHICWGPVSGEDAGTHWERLQQHN